MSAEPKTIKEERGPKKPTELFVRSIPFEATNEELTEFFSEVAPVKHAIIVTDSASKMSKGFGFVSFSLPEDAEKSLAQCRKKKFKDRLLKIEFAKPRERSDKPKKDDAPVIKTTQETEVDVEKRRPRLIVRNLPWSVRDTKELEKTFSKYGQVTQVLLPRGPNGKMKGFAFVTMRKQTAAELAVKESSGLKIDGREVAVDYAIQKDKWVQHVKEETPVEGDDDNESSDEDEDNNDDDDEENEEDNENDEDDEDNGDDEDKPVKQWGANTSYTVFVRNIPYDATAETLKEHFEAFGAVRYALPVTDKETGQARGVAFVAFYNEEDATNCVKNAPASGSTSLLLPDDTNPDYMFDGRILSVTAAVERETAGKLASAGAKKRAELLGKAPAEKDRRNLFLLNEGRINPDSKLAETMPASELEIRQQSYKLRKEQVSKNPGLHVSLTRLAIRNLPRAMNERSLKAIARKAVVQFATDVADKNRQPISKEEVLRSIKARGEIVKSKHGVVKQAKVIMETKAAGELGRSRGYGFVEFRDHKAALMGLRWLNAHVVTDEEILEGRDDEEKKNIKLDPTKQRRLIAEFAIENAQVVQRRRDSEFKAREFGENRFNKRPFNNRDNKKSKPESTPEAPKVDEEAENIKKIIGAKRAQRKHKRGKK
ncbi:RNA-binding domain-containing protein [Nadsonia fulvescens var. elongata DSM 6958]|uniref:RNA-binding domain-containing protein n=1 Tax=Nadsonia fulvescens var. elongata DSM 6958 TaxID=857566 RepID=A0A1E3PIN2_9ASCO|nr:RNA-binding domain-containing protein [Nadsonia fulvescens var. elongata DSM 6958]